MTPVLIFLAVFLYAVVCMAVINLAEPLVKRLLGRFSRA